MKTIFYKQFVKQYTKLPDQGKKRFEKAIILFRHEPKSLVLYNHPLSGAWKGHRSIAFGNDWRAHYILKDENTALFVAIGTHAQLYK